MEKTQSYARLLIGIILGFLVGDQLVDLQKLPGWPVYLGVIIDVLAASAVVVFLVFPRHAPLYKYGLGQLGAWLVSLIIGGWLPLVKGVLYSNDFWTIVILMPMHAGIIYTLIRVQSWFDTPRPGWHLPVNKLKRRFLLP